tara:strand:+ start:9901 stop:10224 length:324 start_codon:yes stop_codon:yes gene_type:complete
VQLTLNFDAGLVDAYPTCREYVAHRVHHQGRPQKAIAADMDYSPSHLSRKCAQSPDDSMRLTCDDLERFIETTGDTSPVLYLVEKYLTDHDRIAELEAELARLKGQK